MPPFLTFEVCQRLYVLGIKNSDIKPLAYFFKINGQAMAVFSYPSSDNPAYTLQDAIIFLATLNICFGSETNNLMETKFRVYYIIDIPKESRYFRSYTPYFDNILPAYEQAICNACEAYYNAKYNEN